MDRPYGATYQILGFEVLSMKLIQAKYASEKRLNKFLENNQEVDKMKLMKQGYVVKISNKIIGCFTLERINDGRYWLNQLYITNTEAVTLPILVEAILVLAKQQKATEVFVNSHKLMVDIILDTLQFRQQVEAPFLAKCLKSEGKWWSYAITD